MSMNACSLCKRWFASYRRDENDTYFHSNCQKCTAFLNSNGELPAPRIYHEQDDCPTFAVPIWQAILYGCMFIAAFGVMWLGIHS